MTTFLFWIQDKIGRLGTLRIIVKKKTPLAVIYIVPCSDYISRSLTLLDIKTGRLFSVNSTPSGQLIVCLNSVHQICWFLKHMQYLKKGLCYYCWSNIDMIDLMYSIFIVCKPKPKLVWLSLTQLRSCMSCICENCIVTQIWRNLGIEGLGCYMKVWLNIGFWTEKTLWTAASYVLWSNIADVYLEIRCMLL